MSSKHTKLAGRRVVITRARLQAESLAGLFEALGAEVVFFPTIVIEPLEDLRALDEALQHLERYDLVALGSQNAARIVFDRLDVLGRKLDRPIACVGAKTQAFVRTHVTGPVYAPTEHRAEALAETVLDALGAGEERRVLFPRAPEGREFLIDALEAAGITVDAIPVYRIRPVPPSKDLSALANVDVFTFLSGETLRAFFETLGAEVARKILAASKVAVIGPVAAEQAQKLGVRVDVVPREATTEGLVEGVAALTFGEKPTD